MVQCFQQLHRLLDEHYTDEDRLIIAAPTMEQVDKQPLHVTSPCCLWLRQG